MLNENIIRAAFEKLAKNPIMKMPNIPWPVMNAGAFWNTLGEYAGCKFEQNLITQHCRILDNYGVRRAWGSETAMERLIMQMAGYERSTDTE
ncbi:hypothetical protein [Ruminococcus sp. HUN007]|uniref:hypothetical protein n=1 Tax=Ruminococcus sp. HUN007 TaxID=1514668 RepID=UPI0005D2905D|nr:hypothetical protein [Ruminococcus sp. HUN007]